MSKKREEAARKALADAGVKKGAAEKIIQQAVSTGKKGLSPNELAFIQQNAGQLVGQTKSQVDAKAFLGTTGSRMDFLSSGTGAGTSGSGKTVVSYDTYIDSNGNRIRVALYSDGSTGTPENLGLDSGVSQQRTNWISELTSAFESYGLGSLVPAITGFIQQGYTPDTISLKLADTPEYKQRFIANEDRRKKGLSVLDPATYLATEASYRTVMRAAGLPEGFYDQPDDFAKFIANDLSPSEFKQRVDIASLSINSADPFFIDTLSRMYNISAGEMVAYALDPDRALPFITRQVQAAQFGAEGARQGLQIGTPMAETYVGLGVTREEAAQGFEQIAQILPEAERLSSVFRDQTSGVGMEETTSAVLGGEQSAEYKRRLQRLSEMEQSLFAGSSGVSQFSLQQGQAGQF
jgi:hypothetical protein